MLARFARNIIDDQIMFKALFARQCLEYEPNPHMRFQLVRTLKCALIGIFLPVLRATFLKASLCSKRHLPRCILNMSQIRAWYPTLKVRTNWNMLDGFAGYIFDDQIRLKAVFWVWGKSVHEIPISAHIKVRTNWNMLARFARNFFDRKFMFKATFARLYL